MQIVSLEAICMKGQSLFSEKKKKKWEKYFKMSAEIITQHAKHKICDTIDSRSTRSLIIKVPYLPQVLRQTGLSKQ